MTFYYLFQQNKSYDSSRYLRCDCWWSRWNGTLPSSAIPASGWSIYAYYIYNEYSCFINGISDPDRQMEYICILYYTYTTYIPKIYIVYPKDIL